MQFNVYPTRIENSHLLFSWHSNTCSDFGSLGSVKIYLTETYNSDLTTNSDWEYGDDNPFSDMMTPAYSYNVTSSATDGDLYETWIKSGYYVVAAVQYTSAEDSSRHYVSFCWNSATSPNNVAADAPSLSYDSESNKFTIGTAMRGYRILEFYNPDHDFGYPTSIDDEETLNEMFYVSLVDMENSNPYKGYYNVAGNTLERWAPGSYTVGVQFNNSTNQSTISSAITNAISKINNVLNDFGVYFTRSGTEGDITITVDSEENLYGIDLSDGIAQGGEWHTYPDDDGYIYKATITLANDYYESVPYVPYKTVAIEELAQAMGAGYDQVEYPFNTLHTEFNYYNKSASITTKDANILRLVYSDYVSAGDGYTNVARELNIPKGCYQVVTGNPTSNNTKTVSASFLKKGCNYKVRVFIVNSSGEVSETSDWIDVSIPPLSAWSWTSSNGEATAAQTKAAYNAVYNGGKKSGGSVSDFSYLVWNDMCAKVQEIFDYAGNGSWSTTYATYNNTLMTSSSKTLTAKRFNSLRFNIGSYVSTGISEVSAGDVVKGEYFLTLAECLNEWIDNVTS